MVWHRAEFAILIFVLALGRWRPQRCPEVLWTADTCLFDILRPVEQGDADPAFQDPRVNPPRCYFGLGLCLRQSGVVSL